MESDGSTSRLWQRKEEILNTKCHKHIKINSSSKTQSIKQMRCLIRHFKVTYVYFSVMNDIIWANMFQSKAICYIWMMLYNIDLSSLTLFICLCLNRRQNVVLVFDFGKHISFKLFRFRVLHMDKKWFQSLSIFNKFCIIVIDTLFARENKSFWWFFSLFHTWILYFPYNIDFP